MAGSGPPVILLHGFPEFWYAWRHQIPVLAEHYTVIAPDLRGYGYTEKPHDGYDKRTTSPASGPILPLIYGRSSFPAAGISRTRS
ncbi:MAG: alpha/beta fold hydrolase, partial [Mycobacterium sp.]|nr:alpha/beta fold hydrolase [Mycobacterium sp.]